MQLLRKLVLLLAMVYFLFLVLVITNLVSVAFLDDQFSHFNRDNFYRVMMLIGAVLLAAALAVEQSHAAFLRRRADKFEAALQQLKATHYDAQQRTMAEALNRPPIGSDSISPTGSVVPPASSLPGELR